jgi:hypothetical protein
MARKPSYEDGHLVVAAVRVLSHRQAKPPTPEDVAGLLDMPPEFVRTLVASLGALGVLRVMENPFETRLELGDHALLEDLPKSAEGPSIKDELDSFVQRKKKEVEETERMFTVEEMDKKKQEKLAKMEDEIKRMKKTKYQPFPD